MSWVRIDDGQWCDPQYLSLSPESRDLFTRILSYCGQRLNDGVLGRPEVALAAAGQPADAARLAELTAQLVDGGYMTETPVGWRIVDPFRYLRPRADVEAYRESRRAGGLARGRSLHQQSSEHDGEHDGEHDAEHDAEHDGKPRPVPSRPDSRPHDGKHHAETPGPGPSEAADVLSRLQATTCRRCHGPATDGNPLVTLADGTKHRFDPCPVPPEPTPQPGREAWLAGATQP
jgi:hypothetical protein